jgi:hypothetical protein
MGKMVHDTWKERNGGINVRIKFTSWSCIFFIVVTL